MDSIKEQIFQLENDLIKSEVRKSAEKINEILSNDFVEFSSSGSEFVVLCGQRKMESGRCLFIKEHY